MRVRAVPLLLLLLAGCNHDGGGNSDGGDTDGSVGSSMLEIAPAFAVLTVRSGMAPPTVTYIATYGGQSVPATFSLDRGELGTLDPTSGLFTPGAIGGIGHVTATWQSMTATTTVTVQEEVTQNGDPAYTGAVQTGGAGGYGGVGGSGPGGPASTTQQTTLGGTATVDANVKLLYPYDGTVFPRGLLPPLLMWNPGGHLFDSVKLELKSKSGSYHFVGTFAKPVGASIFNNLIVPAATWQQMAYSASGDEVTVSLTFAQGTNAYGPYVRKWLIAPATLKGTVYYNSYGTALATNFTGLDSLGRRFGGATLGIKPGATDPVLVAGFNSADNSGCRVCHTVSAKGGKLFTQRGDNYAQSVWLDLNTPGPEKAVTPTNLVWSTLSPDGNLLFSHALVPSPVIPAGTVSKLYDLSGAGALVSGVTGLPADLVAALPSFSPDGKRVAFNAWGGTGYGADKKSLGLVEFDGQKTFSSIRTAFTPTTGAVAWPTFFPTSQALVFEIEQTATYYGETRYNNHGKLSWIDLASGMSHPLDQLNGEGYLPKATDVPGAAAGHADDTLFNYEPTVNPIASGGYAWVVFTSRRMYGNIATIDPMTSDPRDAGYDYKTQYTCKKLWVAAVDLNAQPGTDPSHPAFYLPAQEIHAGNSRGFWTTEPCRSDGNACESGDECCGGYCRAGGDGGALVCSSTMNGCAQLSEKCNTDADCCPSFEGAVKCVNNLCVQGSPPIP